MVNLKSEYYLYKSALPVLRGMGGVGVGIVFDLIVVSDADFKSPVQLIFTIKT